MVFWQKKEEDQQIDYSSKIKGALILNIENKWMDELETRNNWKLDSTTSFGDAKNETIEIKMGVLHQYFPCILWPKRVMHPWPWSSTPYITVLNRIWETEKDWGWGVRKIRGLMARGSQIVCVSRLPSNRSSKVPEIHSVALNKYSWPNSRNTAWGVVSVRGVAMHKYLQKVQKAFSHRYRKPITSSTLSSSQIKKIIPGKGECCRKS